MNMAQTITVDTRFPNTLNLQGHDLILNGQGSRTKLMITVYQLGLYLSQPSTDAQAILQSDTVMALRLEITSSLITSDKMAGATREGFAQANPKASPELQAHIDQLISAFQEDINQGDHYDMLYLPGQGVEIYKNGQLSNSVASDNSFKQALFAIWLGKTPVQKTLKKALITG